MGTVLKYMAKRVAESTHWTDAQLGKLIGYKDKGSTAREANK